MASPVAQHAVQGELWVVAAAIIVAVAVAIPVAVAITVAVSIVIITIVAGSASEYGVTDEHGDGQLT